MDEPVTQRAMLDALEAAYPMLRGTVRDHTTRQRRAFVRFFACGRTYRTNRRMTRCPKRWSQGKNRL